ncbi:MAG TPA: DUF1572 domain-containing protein [Chitinophagaceae bacterium]|nr:DUF1572 domain-containing protein [Chitinophagaceae bacterium]
MATSFLSSAIKEFQRYRSLGEKAIEQIPDEMLLWQYNPESNSVAIIVKHMAGNMLSRWTDIFNSDGEKEWRKRDAEFVNDLKSREEILTMWNKGWELVFNTLNSLTEQDLERTIYIRGEAHTVVEAIHRQLAHYPSHVGQIIYIGKMVCDAKWTSLSIPRNRSDEFNNQKFSEGRH